MEETMEKGIEFDPGFAPYIFAFQGSVQYLYGDINRFKNLSQRQMKFRQYYNKILQVFYNNVGFYTGCLMWASYIKSQPKQEITGNHCYGQEYSEDANKIDTQNLLNFYNSFPKDIKYYLGQDFSFDTNIKALIETYEEFCILNKGFVDSKYNTDIKLPGNVKTDNPEEYKSVIENIIKDGDLSKLKEYITTIIQVKS